MLKNAKMTVVQLDNPEFDSKKLPQPSNRPYKYRVESCVNCMLEPIGAILTGDRVGGLISTGVQVTIKGVK